MLGPVEDVVRDRARHERILLALVRRAPLHERLGVEVLVVAHRAGERDEERGLADARKLEERRGARAADDEVRRRVGAAHLVLERPDARGDAGRLVARLHGGLVRRARLVDDEERTREVPLLQVALQEDERLAHEFVHPVGALAAPRHEDAERIGGHLVQTRLPHDLRPHRQSRQDRLVSPQVFLRLLEGDRHLPRRARQELHRAPRNGIRLVQHHGNGIRARGEDRREARIRPHREQGIRREALHLGPAPQNGEQVGKHMPRTQLPRTRREDRAVPRLHHRTLDGAPGCPDDDVVPARLQFTRDGQTWKRMPAGTSAGDDELL